MVTPKSGLTIFILSRAAGGSDWLGRRLQSSLAQVPRHLKRPVPCFLGRAESDFDQRLRRFTQDNSTDKNQRGTAHKATLAVRLTQTQTLPSSN
jgi:hypothetical protein